MDFTFEAIKRFGQKVLDYLLSTSNDGDTILFAIDDDIYESTLFEGVKSEKEDFERQIKFYVKNNGLNYSRDANIALALAAHQIKLAYDSKSTYDDFENNIEKKTINDSLMDFYFPGDINEQILYRTYYDSLNNLEDNLQDRLWLKIRTILKENNRNCIIPIGLKGKNREQKYINAQLVVLRSLKYYFIRVFYFGGISKNTIYTRESFEKCIEKNLESNNSCLLNHILAVIQSRLRKYASENDSISFSYDKKILIGQLWNFYNTWDGTDPVFSNYNDDYSDLGIFYLELFEEDEEGPAFFESQKQLNYLSTDINVNEGIYFRLFSPHSDDWWKSEVINSDIPDFSPFVILVEEEDLRLFSSEYSVLYNGNDENTKHYVALKYDRKPDDFYAKLPANNKQKDVEKVSLIGGIKLNRNEYLDVGLDMARPRLNIRGNLNYSERQDDMKLFKKIEILNEDSDVVSKYKLIPHQENSIPSNCCICRGAAINGLCIPEKKTVVKIAKKITTEIPKYVFRASLNKMDNKPFIPYEDIRILAEGNEFISIENAGISEEDNNRLKKGIGYGWFSLDQNPLINNNIAFIKEIEFSVELKQNRIDNDFEIVEFEVTDVLSETRKVSSGAIIVRNHSEIKNYHSRKPDNIADSSVKPKRYKYKVMNEELGLFIDMKNDCFYEYDLFCYQEAIYIWLKHKGFATWQQIHNQCSNLVQTSGFYTDFGDRPEYKIFMPLLKIGIVEIYEKNGEYIYCVSEKVNLFAASEHEYSYRNHFLKVDDEIPTVPQKCQKRALEFLKNAPSIKNQITNNRIYYSKDESNDENAVIRFSTRKYLQELRFTRELTSEYPCIFKYKKESYEPDYFLMDQKDGRFKLNKSIPDSLTVCKSFIHAERISKNNDLSKLFTYFPLEKKLVCHYMPDVPVLYARALILNDPTILNTNELFLCYCPNHYEQIFSNVSEEFAQLLDQKYTDRG